MCCGANHDKFKLIEASAEGDEIIVRLKAQEAYPGEADDIAANFHKHKGDFVSVFLSVRRIRAILEKVIEI